LAASAVRIYSLAGLVRNELGFDPSSGDVFVFLGKRLNQIRLLQRSAARWDRDGFAMYVKKLERGTFEWPKSEDIAITSHRRATPQLTLLLQGVMLDSVRLRKRYQHANQAMK
jgi:transposase